MSLLFNMPSPDDRSVLFLSKIFGPIVNYIISGGTMPGTSIDPATGKSVDGFSGHIIALVLIHFNVVLVSGSILLFIYLLIMGVLKTSEEGTFLGKQWSTTFMSLRAIAGPVLMLPLHKGFCAMQYGMMYLILLGVHMATSVWSDTLGDVQVGATPAIPTSVQTVVKQKIAEALLFSADDVILKSIAGATNNSAPFNGSETFSDRTLPILADNGQPGKEPAMKNKEIETIASALCPTGDYTNSYTRWLGKRDPDITTFGPKNIPQSCQETLYSALRYTVTQKNVATGNDPRGEIGLTGNVDGMSYMADLYLGNNVNVPGMDTAHPHPIRLQGGLSFGNFLANKSGHITYDMNIPDESDKNSLIYTYYKQLQPLILSSVLVSMGTSSDLANGDDGDAWQPKCQSLQNCDLSVNTQDLMRHVIAESSSSDTLANTTNPSAVCQNSPNSLSCLCLPGTGANDPAMSTDGMALSVDQRDGRGGFKPNTGHKIGFPVDKCSLKVGCVPKENGGWKTKVDPQTASFPKVSLPDVPVDGSDQPIYLPASYCSDKSFVGHCYFPHKVGQDNYRACPTYTGSWFYGGQVYLSLNERLSANVDNMLKVLNQMQFSPLPGKHIEANYSVFDTFNFALIFEADQFDNKKPWVTWGSKTIQDDSEGKQPMVLMSLSDVAEYLDKSLDQTYEDKYQGPDKNGQVVESYKPKRDPNFDADDEGRWHPKGPQYIEDANGKKTLSVENIALQNLASDLRTMDYDTSIPNALKVPLELLATIQAQFYGPQSTVFAKDQLAKSLINMLQVLRLNGLIPAGASDEYGQNDKAVESEMTNPAKNVVDLIFARLLGCNVTVDLIGRVHYPDDGCSTADSRRDSNSVEGLLKKIYSIGDIDENAGGGLIKGQFNMISQAQQVGEDIISTITESVTHIMGHLSGVMSGNIQQNEMWAMGGIGAAMGAAWDPIGSLGPVLVGVTQLRIQLLGIQQMFSFSQSLMWLPLVIFLFSALFMVGISFTIIMPLTPFLLFWSGQVAWVLGTVEAMVAAPLLLFALSLPGGHGEFGHAVPGIKMLLNVIFRPVLMVIGLFVSISLTYILIHYSSHAFHFAYLSLMNKKSADVYTAGILSIILVLAYTTFITLVYTKCFSAIYVIPERVMMWLGGQGDKAGAEELQQFTQGVTSTSKEATQSAGQSTQADTQSYQTASNQGSQAASQSVQSADTAIKSTKGAIDQDKSSVTKGAHKKSDEAF